MNHEITRELFSAIAYRIEKITGEKPDVFTPAIIAHLLDECVISAILEGKIPGYVDSNETSGNITFHAFFTPSELTQIRVGLSGPFAKLVQVGIDPEVDQPITYVIESLGEPIETETLFRRKRVSLIKKRYNLPSNEFRLKKP